MADRPPFTYRRRETTGGRAEEPETDATDGNVGEGRRELPAVADPASSSLNATLETFTQMMATMTQMLKNIQAPASGSGGGPIGGSSGGPGTEIHSVPIHAFGRNRAKGREADVRRTGELVRRLRRRFPAAVLGKKNRGRLEEA
ncbi:hypothetical protein M5K25_005839 [Dendrobium thyrsiflorum]|uniref:Uncharacterized protein n=1 Tax=Dendrobium thyrsiflorum TaxID=117978 RepID=A0ABD0VA46_DENTH